MYVCFYKVYSKNISRLQSGEKASLFKTSLVSLKKLSSLQLYKYDTKLQVWEPSASENHYLGIDLKNELVTNFQDDVSMRIKC